MGGGVVAEAAIEEGLELATHAIPVERRGKDDAIGGQIVFQEEFAETILKCAFALLASTLSTIAQEMSDIVIDKEKLGSIACLLRASPRRICESIGIAVTARARS